MALRVSRSRRSLPPLVFALLAACTPPALAFMPGCGVSEVAPTAPAGRSLPPYAGQLSELFDDVIEPRAVGMELDQMTTARGDAHTRARAQTSDAVVRARISTVTGKVDGPTTSFQVGFRVVDTLAGSNAGKFQTGDDFTVKFDKTSPSLGILRSFEGRLVGKTMIVFVKSFGRFDGESEIHVHVAPDTTDEAEAVREATALEAYKNAPASGVGAGAR